MDTSTIKNIAELARIKLTREEEELYSKQLEDILGYFDLLKEVNTDEVDLDKTGRRENLVSMRSDDEKYFDQKFSKDILMSDLPEREGKFVKVPSVINK